jgi:hypothetical protein
MNRVVAAITAFASCVAASSHNDTHSNTTDTTTAVIDDSTTAAPNAIVEVKFAMCLTVATDRAGFHADTQSDIVSAFTGLSQVDSVDYQESYVFGTSRRQLALTSATPAPTPSGNFTCFEYFVSVTTNSPDAPSTSSVATTLSAALPALTVAGQTYTATEVQSMTTVTVTSGGAADSTTTSGSIYTALSSMTMLFIVFLRM